MRHDIFFPGGAPEYIVAGLGNPGARYNDTRHNVGFMALDYIAEKLSAKVKRIKFNALVDKCFIGGVCVLLLKPQTFMNNSGLAIVQAAKYYNIKPENVIVCYDDIALPVGAMRIRPSGSAGGHNGLKSIIEHLGSSDFQRIRLGVGAKPEGSDLVDYVLGTIPYFDKPYITDNFQYLIPALEFMVHGETEKAMSRYNKPGKTDLNENNN